LRWAGTIAASEYAARRVLSSRATALLIAYAGLAVAAASTGVTGDGGRRRRVPAGAVAVALGGYPLGRAVARDASPGAPSDGLVRELVVLGVVVPVAEELVWGRLVEDDLGVVPTSALFSLKHGVIDGRWRRSPGLAAFWVGLGGIRRASRGKALALHLMCNAIAVLLGHVTARDQF
jgi:hypothetical protein